jgi:hypothetical protein
MLRWKIVIQECQQFRQLLREVFRLPALGPLTLHRECFQGAASRRAAHAEINSAGG